ncbi:MAG: hypothetical protein CL850_03270 [Crocinitomicaceae bacterium]|nr:hypothetical protein [Crocinitomicaceae bacterium]|tara:strand:+ start:1164 stop:1634 length:471 start_codon:yes stop_codon:yes gene_type:complete
MSLLFIGCAKNDHTHPDPEPVPDNTTGTNSIDVVWELNDSGGGIGFYSVNLSIPSITSSVVNNGAVLVYMSNSEWDSTEWVALPYTEVYGTDYFSSVTYSFQEGLVTVLWADSDFIIPDYPSFDTFRVVVIEDRSSITDQSILELINKYENYKKAG